MSKLYLSVLWCILAFSPSVYADVLEIVQDGVYVSGEKVLLSSDADVNYIVTGTITHEGISEEKSYIDFGLLPYNSHGEKLAQVMEFVPPYVEVNNGLNLLDSFEMSQAQTVQISKRIKISGEDVREFSFAVGATLAPDSKITVANLQIVLESQVDSNSDASSLLTSSVPNSNGTIGSGATVDSQASDKPSPLIILLEHKKEDSEKSKQEWAWSRRLIYVNADTGSDNFQGLKSRRGQADGPKRTLRSAFRVIKDGDEVVLQESTQPFVITGAIKPKEGEMITIRPEGNAVIKGSN